jgi:hypothetical protein
LRGTRNEEGGARNEERGARNEEGGTRKEERGRRNEECRKTAKGLAEHGKMRNFAKQNLKPN